MDKKYDRLTDWDLADEVVKQYKKFGVNFEIKDSWRVQKRTIFELNLKGNTRETHIRAHAPDVQLKLKLPLFHVEKYNFTLYIIASTRKIVHPHLPAVLKALDQELALRRDTLPYIVGHDILGDAVIENLAEFPHLLLAGSTNSGKSVGLQALITTIAYTQSPSQVNFILIDVGATDLLAFEGLPHLSCPVICDRAAVVYALNALVAEMERRIELERRVYFHAEPIPRLILVIDEFPALFMGLDKAESQVLAANISSLLQRGRHAKIHVVLAAQNPTFANMRVDLGNITARAAFKCAKKNFSETILGEGGAENLSGNGELLLKTPSHDPERMQGVYVTRAELADLVEKIKARYCRKAIGKFEIAVSHREFTNSEGTLDEKLSCAVVKKGPTKADQQLADTIMWALRCESVSIHRLKTDRHIGWDTASRLIKRLEEMGIVDKPEGKLPRNVIPCCPQDLSEELKRFLADAGYSPYALVRTFCKDNAEADVHTERSESDESIND